MSNSKNRISFIGAGNLASALIHGLVHSGYSPELITASAPTRNNLEKLESTYGISVFQDNAEAVKDANIVILAVKPQNITVIANEISSQLAENALMISLALGVRCKSITKALGRDLAIVRSMPNTPAQLSLGATGLFANEQVTSQQKHITEEIIQAIGITCWVEDENMIDVITGISGSGPAYFFLFMEALVDAGIKRGLDEKSAHTLAVQTALGAAKLAQTSGESLQNLRKKVTSPNGSTEKAIAAFEANQLRETVDSAVDAAVTRAKELADFF